MAVFDPRQGQVLISPVTSFYQGKAIRQEIKRKEMENKLLEFESDTMEERFQWKKNEQKRAEAAERRAEDLAKRQQEAFEMTVGKEQATLYAQDLYSRIHASELVASVEGPEAAMQHALQNIQEYGETLPEEFQGQVMQVLEDGKVTPVELAMLKKRSALYLGISDTTKDLKKHVKFAKVNPDGSINWQTLRAAREGSAIAGELAQSGYVPVGMPPTDDSGDDGADFDKAITSRLNNEEFMDYSEDLLKVKQKELNVDDIYNKNGEKISAKEENIVEREFAKYLALYETHNPNAPGQEMADSIFRMMFNVEHLGNGETILHLRDVQTVHKDGADYVKMPSNDGMRWYKVNTP
jgi:hypothetical protein